MENVLELRGLNKTYMSGGRPLRVLRDVSLDLEDGATCAIVGPSGSGKTTLLGLAAGLDSPTSGEVKLCGAEMNVLSEDSRARVRNQYVGFVFQSFRLIPTLTALENVLVPAELSGRKDAARRASELLEQVGLADRQNHYPSQLSGGEQQRVGLARAFVNRPRILFADEPTGNLDTETGHRVAELLFELNRTAGTTLVLVTHDIELASRTKRLIRLRGGAIDSDSAASAPGRAASDHTAA
jgi:putative ABC transport system ATP-binding protein